MRKLLAIGVATLGILLVQPATASAEIEGGKNGLYFEVIKGGFGKVNLIYRVDTVTRLCFAGFFTDTQVPVSIPCENLARRPGWSEIITWVQSRPEADQ